MATPAIMMPHHYEAAMDAVRWNGDVYNTLRAELKNDRLILKAAVQSKGMALMHAPRWLTYDREIAMEAVTNCGLALGSVGHYLADDKELVLAAVRQDGFALRFASERLRDDCDVVFEAVLSRGAALSYAGEMAKDDRVVVMNAVQTLGSSLQFASDRLRADEGVLLEAMRKSEGAHQYAMSPHVEAIRQAAASCLATVNSWAPALTINRVSFEPGTGTMLLVAITTGGQEVRARFDKGATIGFAVKTLHEESGVAAPYVRAVLPGGWCMRRFDHCLTLRTIMEEYQHYAWEDMARAEAHLAQGPPIADA